MAAIPVTKELDRRLDARPDTLDFRDLMYVPSLVDVPIRRTVEEYRRTRVPILDQGQEGACTGFGLATVVHYLLRTRKVVRSTARVSPRMLYEMAKRHDEFPGEDYSGSSARGAMKGWYKHGVCTERKWPYVVAPGGKEDADLTSDRAHDALDRPLGAYMRVNHTDLVALHSAIADVGVLYATAKVHAGWREPGRDGVIAQDPDILGGHAFAVVGFDERGLWIQNSWGPKWGLNGFGLITYDDWLTNGTDTWVARLGSPITLGAAGVARSTPASVGATVNAGFVDIRPHVISIGNDGLLKQSGTYATTDADITAIFDHFLDVSKAWQSKRLLLYAHGGLVPEGNAIQRIANYREALLRAEVYPIGFIWHSDFWSTITDILTDALGQRQPDQGWLQATKDFMLDRLDDALEPVARALGGPTIWGQMKQNAEGATISRHGGARKTLAVLADRMRKDPAIEVHAVGHSAGSIFHGPLVQLLTTKGTIGGSGPLSGEQGYGLPIKTCTMWAPAITIDRFKEFYLPAITARGSGIGRFVTFNLTDRAEQDDHCANVYHKSLLYLVSNSFETQPHIPLLQDGTKIFGMVKFASDRFKTADKDVAALFSGNRPKADLVVCPNDRPVGARDASRAEHHGGFDDDSPTVVATLARIAPNAAIPGRIDFPHSAVSVRELRRSLPQPV